MRQTAVATGKCWRYCHHQPDYAENAEQRWQRILHIQQQLAVSR